MDKNKNKQSKRLGYYLSSSKNVYYSIMQDRAVVFIPAENSFYTLNREGTRIWELADGKRTIRKICEILCSEFRVSRDAVSRDAVSFIKHLSDKGLFVYLRKKR